MSWISFWWILPLAMTQKKPARSEKPHLTVIYWSCVQELREGEDVPERRRAFISKKDIVLLLLAEIQRSAHEQAFLAIVSPTLTVEFYRTISGSELVHHITVCLLRWFRRDGHMSKSKCVKTSWTSMWYVCKANEGANAQWSLQEVSSWLYHLEIQQRQAMGNRETSGSRLDCDHQLWIAN